jgi:hypothetical protein
MTGSRNCTAEAAAKAPIRTLKFKVRSQCYPWLNAAAVETNQVWNFFNASSYKAARPFAGKGKWLTGFDLCNLSAGATEYFEHIGADTIQRIATEYATRRGQFKRAKLRWGSAQDPVAPWVGFPSKPRAFAVMADICAFAAK